MTNYLQMKKNQKIILVDGQMCNVFKNSIKYKLYVFNLFLFKPPFSFISQL